MSDKIALCSCRLEVWATERFLKQFYPEKLARPFVGDFKEGKWPEMIPIEEAVQTTVTETRAEIGETSLPHWADIRVEVESKVDGAEDGRPRHAIAVYYCNYEAYKQLTGTQLDTQYQNKERKSER